MKEIIQVLLADKNPLMRVGIRATLTLEEDFKVVGEATNGYEVRQMSEELKPNVLLFDLNMSDLILPEIVAYLREQCPEVRLLILTNHDTYMPNLVASGVAGCVFKEEEPKTLVCAIRTVKQGRVWFSQTVLQKMVQWETANPLQTQKSILTDREQQILNALVQGWDNARIATELSLAQQTVRNYISRIYTKLAVSSRTEAVLWAMKHLRFV